MKLDLKALAIVLAVAALATVASLYAPSPIKEPCVALAVVAVGALRSFLGGGGDGPKGPPLAPLLMLGALGLGGCSFLESHPKLPVDVTREVLCVLSADSTDPETLIAQCGAEIAPIVEDLIREKAAAAKAGFKLPKPIDAGAE